VDFIKVIFVGTIDKLNTAARVYVQKNPNASREDLLNHLNGQSGSSSDEVKLVVDSFKGLPDPPPSSVPKVAQAQWYSFDPKSDINTKIYFQEVLQNRLPHAVGSISYVTEQLINFLPNPKESLFTSVSGLVVGNVQSGKTATFTGLIARAADAGYNLIIIFPGGNFNDLRAQTQYRLIEDLVEPINSKAPNTWHIGTGVNDDLKGDLGDDEWDPNWDGTNTCLIVTKKNKDTLSRLNAWVKKKMSTIDNINMFVIDDESDHASINVNLADKNAEDPTAINQLIRKLLLSNPRHAYVGFTASPFANVFVPPFEDHFEIDGKKVPTLFPRDFIYALPTPEGYFGLEVLCKGDIPKENQFLQSVDEDEAIFYRKNADVKLPLDDGLRDGLKHATFDFFITLGIRFIRRDYDKDFHHSMLIHVKETKKHMHPLKKTLEKFSDLMRNVFQYKEHTMENQKKLCKEFLDYYNGVFLKPPHEVKSPPSDDVLLEAIRIYYEPLECELFPEVKEISSDKDEGDNLVYIKGLTAMVAAIGGNRLSRGYTLEGLFVSYFIRKPQELKSDALLQQGRWFGFRGKDLDLVRIHTTDILINEFWELKRIEADLRDQLFHFQNTGLKPKDFAVPVLKVATQIPTAMNRIPHKGEVKFNTFKLDYLPKNRTPLPIDQNIYRIEHEKLNQSTILETGKLIDKLTDKSPLPIRVKGNYEFNDVPLKSIELYFNNVLGNFIGDPYYKDDLLKYLKMRKTQGLKECSSWTVVLCGLVNGTDSKIFTASKTNPPVKMALRGKIKDTNDVGYFFSTKDFEIGIKTSVKSVSKNLAKRKRENPLLLIYVIDNKSSPNGTRVALNTKDPIIALGIGFPNAELTPQETAANSKIIWYNSDLELEGDE
jgi:hypothetical protein